VSLLVGEHADMYSFLGVEQDATPSNIHTAFAARTSAWAWDATRKKDYRQALLGAVYGILANEESRIEYDRFLRSRGLLLQAHEEL
jgi:DnaJ-class molecular chaperone